MEMPTETISQSVDQKYREYKERIKKLDPLYKENSFSSNKYKFEAQEEDFEVIKQNCSTILLYITNYCNSNCKICFRESSPYDGTQEMSKKEIKNILRKVGRGKRIILIGGEPTVREDLFDIIKLIKKSGNSPELFTNGLKLSNIEYVQKLKETGISRIYFSFEGFKKEIYNEMKGDPEELNLKLSALQNLKFFDFNVTLSSTIAQDINDDQVKPILKYVVENVRDGGFIDGIYFYGATDFGRFQVDKSAAISTPELIKLVEEQTDMQVDIDYLIETKKLLLNFSSLISKYSENFYTSIASRGLMGVYTPGSIKRSFDISTLKMLNKDLREGNGFKAALKAIKDSKMRKIMSRAIRGKKMIDTLGDKDFLIGLGNVNNPKDHSPVMRGIVGIGKSLKNPTINISAYESGFEEMEP